MALRSRGDCGVLRKLFRLSESVMWRFARDVPILMFPYTIGASLIVTQRLPSLFNQCRSREFLAASDCSDHPEDRNIQRRVVDVACVTSFLQSSLSLRFNRRRPLSVLVILTMNEGRPTRNYFLGKSIFRACRKTWLHWPMVESN